MTKSEQIIQAADSAYLSIYRRFPVVFDHGDGVYLYDVEGKKYLDFGAGIAVMGLGYGHKRYNEALKKQIDKLIHTSNLFYHEPGAEAAQKLRDASGLNHVFFTNSGTEAVEGALKLAKKHANQAGKNDYDIIAMKHSFHGRSLGALSVTGNDHYQEPFRPLIQNIKFADYNDLKSVEALVSDNTSAVIMETIQGEGGIYPATEEFLNGVRALCDKHNALLILDEIQCGMGRSGYMFAFQKYDIEPDILLCAKALGCGVPVGAFVCNDKAASMTYGDHGTTYGGNPLVCAAVSEVFDIFKEEKIVEHVKEVGEYLWNKLEELKSKYDCIVDHRGRGLIQGLEFSFEPKDLVRKCLDGGLVVIAAENKTVRFVPPLVINYGDVDEMVEMLVSLL
ncbi:MAG: aspartate aminotransferase family protein [Bacteroidales bacterium]|nr:aspartate aminotransferase family protein [Bacteroidales bacterium]